MYDLENFKDSIISNIDQALDKRYNSREEAAKAIYNIRKSINLYKGNKSETDMSGSTLTNYFRGSRPIPLHIVLSICNALGVSFDELVGSKNISSSNKDTRQILNMMNTDNSDYIFSSKEDRLKYLAGKTFNLLCHAHQSSNENRYFTGKVVFGEEEETCSADITINAYNLDTIESDKSPITPIPFNYRGNVVYSRETDSFYLISYGIDRAEFMFFIFRDVFEPLKTTKPFMAEVLTNAGGEPGKSFPVSFRMLFTKNEIIDKVKINQILPLLQLNEKKFYIDKDLLEKFNFPQWAPQSVIVKLKAFLENQTSPSEVTEEIEKDTEPVKKRVFYEFEETDLNPILKSLDAGNKERIMSLLRSISYAPKYNKISDKTDSILEKLI